MIDEVKMYHRTQDAADSLGSPNAGLVSLDILSLLLYRSPAAIGPVTGVGPDEDEAWLGGLDVGAVKALGRVMWLPCATFD